MKCTNCGTENRSGVRFCEECGAPLADAVPAAPVCSNCGTENRPGVRFCEECGASLTAAAPAASVCANCGTKNRPGVRFCEQCGASLAAPAPARPRRRRRRGLAIGLIGVLAAAALAVGVLFLGPAATGPSAPPGIDDLGSITAQEAAAIGASIIAQQYPEMADVPARVTERTVGGNHIYDVTFSVMAPVDGGSFRKAIIVAINTDTETISVFETD